MITGIAENIYPQKNCSFNLLWFNTDNNWSGNFNLGNSESEDLQIDFISGKIYQGSNFIYSIQPQEYISLSGNFLKNSFNLFLNENFLYSKTGIFQNISGFSLNWNTGYVWSNDDFFPQIIFYGELPIVNFLYSTSGVISEPILVTISGSQENNGPFEIYSGSIGAYPNDPQSYYFEISGAENWQSGVKIDNGDTFNINIIPTNTRLSNRNTYIPLVLNTNAGNIGRYIFNNRLDALQSQSVSTTINGDISKSNIDLLSQSSHTFSINFDNTESLTNKAVITLSGYLGNNINQNGYQDTFSGSWFLTLNNQNVSFNTGQNIFIGEIALSPNTFNQNKTFDIIKKIQRPNGDIGFTGSAIYTISGNNFLQTGIIGSYINIFREYYTFNI